MKRYHFASETAKGIVVRKSYDKRMIDVYFAARENVQFNGHVFRLLKSVERIQSDFGSWGEQKNEPILFAPTAFTVSEVEEIPDWTTTTRESANEKFYQHVREMDELENNARKIREKEDANKKWYRVVANWFIEKVIMS